MTRMLRESEGRRQGGGGGTTLDGRQRNRLILVCGLLLALEGRGAIAESAGAVAQRCLGQPGRASKSGPPCLSLRGGAPSDALWATTTDPNSGKTYFYNVKTKEVAWSLPAGAQLRPPKKAVTATNTAAPAQAHATTTPQSISTQVAGDHDLFTSAGSHVAEVTVHAPPVAMDAPVDSNKPRAEAPVPLVAAAAQPAAVAAAAQPAATGGLPTANPVAYDSGTMPVVDASSCHPAAVVAQTSAVKSDATGGMAAPQQVDENDSLWKEVTDPATGKVYYYHCVTKESVWTKPVALLETGPSGPSFWDRLRTTAAVTSNVTSSIWTSVGGAAKKLAQATAATASSSSSSSTPAAPAAQSAMSGSLHWDADKRAWVTQQGVAPQAATPQGEMGWVWNGTDWVWQLKEGRPEEQSNRQQLPQTGQHQSGPAGAPAPIVAPIADASPSAGQGTGGQDLGPWQRHLAPDGQSYWWNGLTGESQWLAPTAEQIRQ